MLQNKRRDEVDEIFETIRCFFNNRLLQRYNGNGGRLIFGNDIPVGHLPHIKNAHVR